MKTPADSPLLFVFEMANNHMGSLEHGLRIIREIHAACQGFPFRFGFKLQYRDLDTLIHPAYRNRTDLKYVKRFSETRLEKGQFLELKDAAAALGFMTICTPFDEASVGLIEEHGFDVLKIASCSFLDWPLLERIAKTHKPLIASVAGVALEDIDKVVSFFQHREKDLTLLHCVAEYPTADNNLQLNQIDLLEERYKQLADRIFDARRSRSGRFGHAGDRQGGAGLRETRRRAHRQVAAERLFGQSAAGRAAGWRPPRQPWKSAASRGQRSRFQRRRDRLAAVAWAAGLSPSGPSPPANTSRPPTSCWPSPRSTAN